MRRFLYGLRAFSTGGVSGRLFGFSVFVFVLFLAFVLPREAERSEAYFGESGTPDTSFIYSSDDLYRMASNYGEEGRGYYIRSRFTFDVIWPVFYGLFLWAGISFFAQPLKHAAARHAWLLPLAAVVLDFLENSSASLVMFMYPERLPLVASLAPIFTFTKWFAVALSFAALVVLAALFLVHQWRHRA